MPFHIVDLFAGPGGLDMAAVALGVEEVVGVEWDAGACATRERAGLLTRQGDVRDFGPADFPKSNVLAGGPPCQTFTVAGHGAGRRALDDVLKFVGRLVDRDKWSNIATDLAEMEDERTGLVLQPLHWALEAIDNPDLKAYEAIVLEQVPAVLPVWEAYADALSHEGYTVDVDVLRTEEFGVPQTRRRAILIARRGSQPVRLPAPTHQRYRSGTETASEDGLLQVAMPQKWVSMGEALPDREGPFTVISNYGTGGNPKARGERRSDQPSATVTGKISRNRVVGSDGRDLERFSFSEAGRLQTFPAAYPWSGKDVSQQIGNAVPPRLGMHVLSAALGLRVPSEAAFERLATWKPKSAPEELQTADV
ncbi:DNA cytosine methyltransferase [Streptomyces mirabilis]|uniref:DNA cytosine methyltransferase n=1 Tax=Streptomyces mirabilis TaxID=68239 RepID=UPI002254D4D0|nr:DNA cytosine methyltransferase [Streptomyces mirabilis]MCX4609089.1 DNA cytosine methyltransferase [Streptomyces mirabilis]